MGINQILHRSRLYRWKVEFKRLNREHLRSLEQYYSFEYGDSQEQDKHVVCVMNGNFEAGGLADRLRGIVSVYQVCKELGVAFHVYFTCPFTLQDYLEPAEYDWTIEPEDMSFGLGTDIVCCEVTDDTDYQAAKLHKWLSGRIRKSTSHVIHIYGNPAFCYKENTYSALFHELFRPSESLQKAFDEAVNTLGDGFVAVQLRFTHLLGDLDDYGEVLPETQQRVLIDACLEKVQEIKSGQGGQPLLLLSSDSRTFLAEAREKVEGVYVVEGGIAHTDFTPDCASSVHEKLFLDYLLMARAKHIYRIVGTGMRKSGLPYSASLLNACPLTDIVFSLDTANASCD